MTWMNFVLTFDEWWSTITFCISAFFIVTYTAIAKWWKSPMGATIVSLDGAVGTVVFPEFLNHVFGISILNDRTTGVVLIVALALVPCTILYRTYILWRVNYSGRWKRIGTRLREHKFKPED